jgi:hypothetical protein
MTARLFPALAFAALLVLAACRAQPAETDSVEPTPAEGTTAPATAEPAEPASGSVTSAAARTPTEASGEGSGTLRPGARAVPIRRLTAEGSGARIRVLQPGQRDLRLIQGRDARNLQLRTRAPDGARNRIERPATGVQQNRPLPTPVEPTTP